MMRRRRVGEYEQFHRTGSTRLNRPREMRLGIYVSAEYVDLKKENPIRSSQGPIAEVHECARPRARDDLQGKRVSSSDEASRDKITQSEMPSAMLNGTYSKLVAAGALAFDASHFS